MTDEKYNEMTDAEKEAYLEKHDYMVCESCHEPDPKMKNELCRKCEAECGAAAE